MNKKVVLKDVAHAKAHVNQENLVKVHVNQKNPVKVHALQKEELPEDVVHANLKMVVLNANHAHHAVNQKRKEQHQPTLNYKLKLLK